MTTSDPFGGAPPTELKGPIAQVTPTSGGISPLVAPAPLPAGISGASPGLSAGAAQPIAGPTLPADDPSSIARMIAQLAGEFFGGSSLAPVQASPHAMVSAASSPPTAAAAPTALSPAAAPPGGPSMGMPFGMEVFRFPISEPGAMDAAPYFMPELGALNLDSDRGTSPRVETHQIEPVSEPLVRDLGRQAFDPYAVRRDFPILEERVHGGKRLVWLDNAATTQKPRAVIDRLSYFYEHENSNVHRAAHTLAARATDAYEQGRESVRRFLNAPSTQDIVFVRGATEGINLIAQSWGRRNVESGDEIVITWLEHHANIVPWQMLCAEKGAKLRVAPVDDRGDVILEEYEKLLGPRTRLVAFTQVSNALGTITPAREMIEMAHRRGARVLLDGAQAVSHMPVDVQQLDPDFYVFSGHKVFAPTGIGAVYGKREVLEQMPPWQGGGNMIQDVTFERTTYQPPPGRFEAGTGNIADAVGLGAALDYVDRIGMHNIERYEHDLLVYATERLATVPGLRMIGTSPNKAGVLSFVIAGRRTEDIGGALDKEGIAVRSGHHCAQPILRRFGQESTVRASLAFYNICEDIDALVDALRRL